MAKFAPKRDDGLQAYVVTTKNMFDRFPYERIKWSSSLAEAKREHGWTRQLHTTVTVRRATPEDLENIKG